jgi:hypothetical protein
MDTQIEIPETLRKPKLLRKLLREAIAAEREAEKISDAAKVENKQRARQLRAASAARRSIEDELERSCSANDEEW